MSVLGADFQAFLGAVKCPADSVMTLCFWPLSLFGGAITRMHIPKANRSELL